MNPEEQNRFTEWIILLHEIKKRPVPEPNDV